jgi:outer membrane protein OmpA-like peptidoglycan-associated protein
MNYQKLYYPTFTLIFIIFYIGCSTKKQIVEPKIKSDEKEFLAYPAPMGSETYSLNLLMTKIMDSCQAKAVKDQNNSIFVKHYRDYIKIDLNEKSDFRNGSYVLKKEAKEKLKCIASTIKQDNGYFIVVTGHASDNKESQKNQHLSDDRAISLAELFFNEGIRDEIFAKGCSDKKPDTNNVDNYNKLINRRINIFIYANKSNIKNHCK